VVRPGAALARDARVGARCSRTIRRYIPDDKRHPPLYMEPDLHRLADDGCPHHDAPQEVWGSVGETVGMRYEVWSEGYRQPGESGKAWKMGETDAATFVEACDIVASRYRDYDRATGSRGVGAAGCSITRRTRARATAKARRRFEQSPGHRTTCPCTLSRVLSVLSLADK
jgi:hypothetical protein